MDTQPALEHIRGRVSELKAQSDQVHQRARELARYSASLAARVADTEQAVAESLRRLAELRPGPRRNS